MKYRLSKIRIRLREASLMRHRRRRKFICKKKNIERNRKGRRNYKSDNRNAGTIYNKRNNDLKVIVPEDFTMNNIEGVIDFVNITYKTGNKKSVKQIFIKMDNVNRIDMYAICLLLSLINKLARIQKFCMGSYPKEDTARAFLMDSGFLEIMKSNVIKASSKKYKNQMYMIGKDRVGSVRINESVKRTMVQLTGKEQYYPPVYEIITEICANSVEHANEKDMDKNWLVSISKDENDNIHFILTDSGSGILKTLRRKRSEMFKDMLRDEKEILNAVFHKEYQSVTGEVNRHKGLPSIYEAYEDGFISDLLVLTNNVLYNFGNPKSRITEKEFKGTLISWTITIKNFKKWEQSICM